MLKENTTFLSLLSITFILVYLLLFMTTLLDKISTYNVWFGFLLCAILSVGSLVLSFLSIIGNKRKLLSYFPAAFSFLLILFTIFIYLLPEAEIPPAIPLFFK